MWDFTRGKILHHNADRSCTLSRISTHCEVANGASECMNECRSNIECSSMMVEKTASGDILCTVTASCTVLRLVVLRLEIVVHWHFRISKSTLDIILTAWMVSDFLMDSTRDFAISVGIGFLWGIIEMKNNDLCCDRRTRLKERDKKDVYIHSSCRQSYA